MIQCVDSFISQYAELPLVLLCNNGLHVTWMTCKGALHHGQIAATESVR